MPLGTLTQPPYLSPWFIYYTTRKGVVNREGDGSPGSFAKSQGLGGWFPGSSTKGPLGDCFVGVTFPQAPVTLLIIIRYFESPASTFRLVKATRLGAIQVMKFRPQTLMQ